MVQKYVFLCNSKSHFWMCLSACCIANVAKITIVAVCIDTEQSYVVRFIPKTLTVCII